METWTKFELALGDAEKTLVDSQATQAEIDSQLNALQKAYDGLVKTEVPPVEKPSKDELKDLVAKAEALDTTGKTPESVQALADAIASAKDVLAKDDATEDTNASTAPMPVMVAVSVRSLPMRTSSWPSIRR